MEHEGKTKIQLIKELTNCAAELSQAKRAQEHLKLIFSNLPIVLFSIDKEGKFTLSEGKGLEALGLKPGQVVGQSVFEMYKDIPQILIDVTNALAGKEIVDSVDVAGRTFENHYTPLKNEKNELVGTIGISFDITSRKKIEENLDRKRQEALKQYKLISNLLDIVEITASSFNFNETLYKLLPHVTNFLGNSYCLVFTSDFEKKVFKPTHQWGLNTDCQGRFMSLSIEYNKYFKVFSEKQSEFISDIKETKALPNDLVLLLKQIKTKSLMILPIVYEYKIVALFLGPYIKKQSFNQRDKEMANKLRKHLETFFTAYKHDLDLLNESMSLAQELKMTKTTREIDRVILKSQSQQEVIYGTIELLSKIMASRIIEVMIFDSDNKIFELVASYKDNINLNLKQEFSIKNMGSWESVKFSTVAYIADLSKQKDIKNYEKRFLDRGCKSFLTVPLIARGKLIGLLVLANKEDAAYSVQLLDVIKTLSNQIAIALSNTGLIKQQQELLVGAVNSLVAALDAKSAWTKGHSSRVRKISLRIGNALGLNENQLYKLELAALFHDVGKIGTFDIVLDKQKKLSTEEIDIIKKHPKKTEDILSPIPKLKKIANIASHHHERWDGKGYPDGLAGEEIPYLSRIITIADAYDAMTNDRPYRKAFTTKAALDEIERLAGSQFDPQIIKVFVDVIEEEIKQERKKAA